MNNSIVKKTSRKSFDNTFKGEKKTKILAMVFTLLMILLVIFPLFFIVNTSFKNNQEFYTNIFGLPETWRFENYERAWVEGKIGMFASNSLIVTVTAVLASVILAALAGYALSKMYIPHAETIISILMCLNFVPGVAIYISLYSQLNAFGLGRTLWIMILPYLAWQIPFSTYIYKKFYDSISMEILEAARVDGSSEINTFVKIILPLVQPATATVVVFNFISIWGEYLWASIVSSASTSIRTLPVGLLYFRGEYGIEWGPFAAAICIIVVPLVVVFTYFQKYFIQGLTSGAVKG